MIQLAEATPRAPGFGEDRLDKAVGDRRNDRRDRDMRMDPSFGQRFQRGKPLGRCRGARFKQARQVRIEAGD